MPSSRCELAVLLVGDPHLGAAGARVLRRHCARVTSLIWRRGDAAGLHALRRRIRARRWAVCVSFYNDLIFQAVDLRRFDLALNIHPATPALRGRGYDTLPLVLGHRHYGATVHHLDTRLDAGAIVATRVRALPADTTASALRTATQRLCLALLDELARCMRGARAPSALTARLHTLAAGSARAWRGPCVTSAHVDATLNTVRTHAPDHRVFL